MNAEASVRLVISGADDRPCLTELFHRINSLIPDEQELETISPSMTAADAEGNFLPLPEWKTGQPRPADWPRHIHAPREVYDWAKQQGIDWRTLLEPDVGGR